MIESVRQSCNFLRVRAGNGQATFSVLSNLRAYISLADAVPKPFPFPEAASKQFAELRDAAFRFESHFRALLDQKDTQLRTSDRDNLRRYAEANRRIAAPDSAKPFAMASPIPAVEPVTIALFPSSRMFISVLSL